MMKKRILNYVLKGTMLVALPLLLGSCIGYYGVGYDDGIYGERPVRYVSESPRYESPDHRGQHSQGSYKAYLQEKANEYREFQNELQPSYTPFADVNNYRTPADNQRPTYNSYAGWGENPRQTSVTIYNHTGWGYDPYWDWNYRHSYYWGAGAWYPYNSYYYPYYGYNYYYPYRSGWSFSIGTYSPYWYGSYRYGGYYRPYYYDYYYSPYYYGGRYYDRGYYYGNRDYQGRRYSPSNGVRGDSNRYENYRQNQNLNTRSSSTPYRSNTNTNRGDIYSRSYNGNNQSAPTTSPYRNNNSSRSYDNSSRSYNSNSSGNRSNNNSGSGGFSGTRRNF